MSFRTSLALALTFALTPAVGSPCPASAEPAARGTGFALRVDAPQSVRHGVSSQFTVHLTPTDGRKINEDYPLKVTVTAPRDVELPRAVLGAADARHLDATRAEIPVELMATAAGAKSIVVDVRFAVCTSASCEPQRQKLTFQLDVQ